MEDFPGLGSKGLGADRLLGLGVFRGLGIGFVAGLDEQDARVSWLSSTSCVDLEAYGAGEGFETGSDQHPKFWLPLGMGSCSLVQRLGHGV